MAFTLASSASVSLSSISRPSSPSSSSLSSPSSFASLSSNVCRFQRSTLLLQSEFIGGFRKSSSLTPLNIIVKASSEDEGKDTADSEKGEDGPKEAVSVENLPLESKLQMKLEAKLRMKLAKKIRLRRKRLVRKRRMRKKGRWPPSKLKKNKNV